MMNRHRTIFGSLLALSLVLAGLSLRSHTVAAYPSPPPGAVFLGGDAGQYLAMCDGGSVCWTSINLSGGSGSVSPNCDAGYVLGGTGSGMGCVEAGAGGGALTMPITCAVGEVNCGTTQTSESTVTKGLDTVIQAQPSTHATDNGSGNVVALLGVPNGAGLEGQFSTGRGANRSSYTAMTTLGAFSASYGGLWLGSANAGTNANTGNNFVLIGAASTQLNAPIGGTLYLTAGGLNLNDLNGNVYGWQFFEDGAFDLGSCSGCIGIGPAQSYPTASPSTGGILLEGITGANDLHYFPPTGGPLVNYVIGPSWTSAAVNTQPNFVVVKHGAFARTTSAAPGAALLTIPLAFVHLATIDLHCLGHIVSGSGGSAGESSVLYAAQAFKNVGGTVSALTNHSVGTYVYQYDTDMGVSVGCGLNIVGTDITVTVIGIASTTIDWTVDVTVTNN